MQQLDYLKNSIRQQFYMHNKFSYFKFSSKFVKFIYINNNNNNNNKNLFHKGTDRAGPFMGHFTPPVERYKK